MTTHVYNFKAGGKERDMAQKQRGGVLGNGLRLPAGDPVHKGTQAFPSTPAHTQTLEHTNTPTWKRLSPVPFGKV